MKMEAQSARGSLLERTTVQQLVQGKSRLVEVPYTATVGDTLNALLAHHIVAVAVAAPPGQWIGAGGSRIEESDRTTGAARKHYIGMATVFDIFIHVTEEEELPDVESRLSTPASTVIGHSLEGLNLWALNPSTRLAEAMEPMSKGVHRVLVPVCSSHPEQAHGHASGLERTELSPGYHMLTQTDVVRFLWEHNGELGDFLSSHTVSDAGAVQQTVFAIPADMTVTNAAKCMRNAQLSAVAIVEPVPACNLDPRLSIGHGRRIVGTFSATDLRGCGPDALRMWSSMGVLDFLSRSRIAMRYGLGAASQNQADADATGASVPRPPVTCLPTASLAQVMSEALDKQVHHVWITDEQARLLGIVTFSDILRAVHQHLSPE